MKRLSILSMLLLSLLIYACGNKIEPGSERPERPVIKGVQTETVHSSTVKDFYETTATVKARNRSLVSPKIMGEVEKIYVKEGEPVKKGDLLVKIKSPDIDARVQQAREALEEARRAYDMALRQRELAEKTFKRYENLFKERVITEQEFDEIKTKRDLSALEVERSEKALRRAEASLKEASAYRGYANIRSPLDGVVAEKMIDKGSMAIPGRPLIIIEEPLYRLEASVDEGLLEKVHVGMEVAFEIPSLNIYSSGKISEIVHQVDPATRTFIIKVHLPEDLKLKGGLSGKVRIPFDEKRTLLVPHEAVIKRGEIRALYVVGKDNVVRMRLVRTGKKVDGNVEILSGLKEGETIVVKGLNKVVDGGVIQPSGGAS